VGSDDVVELGKYDGLVGCSASTAPAGGAKEKQCRPGRWPAVTPGHPIRRDVVSMQPESTSKSERQTSTKSIFMAGVSRLEPPRSRPSEALMTRAVKGAGRPGASRRLSNNRLKLAARGRSVSESLRRTRAAA